MRKRSMLMREIFFPFQRPPIDIERLGSTYSNGREWAGWYNRTRVWGQASRSAIVVGWGVLTWRTRLINDSRRWPNPTPWPLHAHLASWQLRLRSQDGFTESWPILPRSVKRSTVVRATRPSIDQVYADGADHRPPNHSGSASSCQASSFATYSVRLAIRVGSWIGVGPTRGSLPI